jgi:CHAT domain-containing protein
VLSVNNLGTLYQQMGQYEQALPLLQRALAIHEKVLGGVHPDTAASFNNLGYLYQAMGQYEQALPLYQRAFTLLLPLPLPMERGLTAGNLCRLYSKLQAASAAILYCKLAVNQFQQVRQDARTLDLGFQRSLTGQVEPAYRELAQLLIQEGRIAEAEQVLGMLKEYEFFEYVRRDEHNDPRHTRADYTPTEQSLVDQLKENTQALVELYTKIEPLQKLPQRTPAQEYELSVLHERRSAESERLDRFWEEIKQTLATRQGGAGERLVQLDEEKGTVRDTLMELHQKTGARPALLYLLPGEKNTTFMVITKDGPFRVQEGQGEKALNALIGELRQSIDKRDPAYRTTASTLYEALIQPVRPYLETTQVDELMLYLTDALRYLPFAALYDGVKKQHLIEQYPLSIYTHVGRETLRDEPAGTWSAVGLGLSEARPNFKALTAIEAELRQIVREDGDPPPTGVLPGKRYLNGTFTRPQFVSLADGQTRYAVMHVATHFHLVPGDEDKSFLVIGDGDNLTLKQIRTDVGMKFRGYDLVTLSACETFLSTDKFAGGEVEGLGALLQKQGAKAVLATLWKVEDTGTARLMAEFYKARGERRVVSKAQALQQAQRALLTGTVKAERPGIDLTHPYYWAPFVLMGNWQ